MDEVKNEDKEFATTLSLYYIIEALQLINDKEENQGTIECPKCKGDLRYFRSSSNGHVWGKCKTENCLSWMQ